MKAIELHDFLTSHGYYYERDSEYNMDVFTNPEVMVGGIKTKLEIYADYYTVKPVWWYSPNQRVGTSASIESLDEESLQLMVQNLIENNKPKPKNYVAFTDGSALNTGLSHPGGSAYIIFDSQGNEVKRMSKGFKHTTSNRMELLAIISVVNSLPYGSSVTIHSDSQYSINVLSGRWNAYDNLDQIGLYRKLIDERNIRVTFDWVRGHDGNVWNELCDQMARGEYNKMLKKTSKPKKKENKPSGWMNKLEEQYYNCITTKGRRKRTKKK